MIIALRRGKMEEYPKWVIEGAKELEHTVGTDDVSILIGEYLYRLDMSDCKRSNAYTYLLKGGRYVKFDESIVFIRVNNIVVEVELVQINVKKQWRIIEGGNGEIIEYFKGVKVVDKATGRSEW